MVEDSTLRNDWHVILPAGQLAINKPHSARLLGEDIVLWRSHTGIHAWRDLCIHRGAKLSIGRVDTEAGQLTCPYHGWTYNTDGRCVHIPAHPNQAPPTKATAQTYHAQIAYGFIWVCMGQPANDIPPFPEWNNQEYRKIMCGPYEFDAAGPRIIENFLDVAHFPFVHAGLLGDPGHAEMEEYEAKITPEGVVAENIRVWQPDPDGTGVGAMVAYTYHVFRPLTAYFIKASEGPSFAIFHTVTPVEETKSIGWMWMAMNYAHDVPEEELRAFEDKVVAQDVLVVQSQRPELLPLDLQSELHLRSDRTAIAYRTWIKQLGLSFGTA